MTGVEIGLASLAAIVVLIYLGMHVAVALALTSFLGVWALKGSPLLASRLLALATFDGISSYVFGVVPLFVLMGLVVSAAGIGKDTFEVAERLFRRLRGGLGVATVGANAVFAAITGISIASAAVFTKVAVPEMIRFGYRPRFAVGVVAGSSVLGMLIPPSLLFILYGILTEQSVGDLFIAGIGPGILLAVAYAVAIVAAAYLAPRFVDAGAGAPPTDAVERLEALVKLGPIAVLVALVLGGIYGGLFTPTEAGAVGALGAILIALAKRRLDGGTLWRVVVETGHVTASICFLLIAAGMYMRMLSLTGLPEFLGHWIVDAELGVTGLVLAYVAVVLLMGTILDSSSIMLVMVPLVLPVVTGYGVDLVWFGVITVLAVEIGLLTPPFGLSAFVIKSSLADDSITLGDVFAGALPFALVMLAVLGLVIAFPALSTGLL